MPPCLTSGLVIVVVSPKPIRKRVEDLNKKEKGQKYDVQRVKDVNNLLHSPI
jgi:hypothetical protein